MQIDWTEIFGYLLSGIITLVASIGAFKFKLSIQIERQRRETAEKQLETERELRGLLQADIQSLKADVKTLLPKREL